MRRPLSNHQRTAGASFDDTKMYITGGGRNGSPGHYGEITGGASGRICRHCKCAAL